MRLAVVLTAVCLSGCMAGTIFESQADRSARIAAERAQIDAAEDATCKSYGLKFGTPEYATCRQNIAGQRIAAVTALLAARPAAVSCSTYTLGKTVNTDCR